MARLNSEQVEFLRREGYLMVPDVLSPSLFDTLKAEFDETVDRYARDTQARGLLDELFEAEPFERRLACVCEAVEDPSDLLRQVNGKLRTPGMFAVMICPAILDIVESFIGPEVFVHPQFNARAKMPNQDATVVPWHQDLGYLEPDAEETFMVNFWIPLVNANRDNGCLEVIAGSHRMPLAHHETGLGPAGNFKGLTEDRLPPGERVLCPLEVGGVLLIQHKTLHRSLPNTSDHIRWSLDLRYSDPAMPSGRDSVPGFIARSERDAGCVTRSLEDWQRIMEKSGAPKGA